MAEDWTKEWERRIVNGVYPLRRFLGRSNHSVVFLTECQAQKVPQAAIKILPVTPALSDAQLKYWKTVATLSHPHLIRLLDFGQCQLGGHNFLFVVMDYAEQNLAQLLPSRALTPDEVRDLMPATLDALTFLHGKNLVQGGLKPSNFLVVDDQLKLASDTIRPAGERAAITAKPTVYDPPEARNGSMSGAGDVWALGISLVEALTQIAPAVVREGRENISLPANLAPDFVDTIERCLDRDRGRRPTVGELTAQFSKAAVASVAPAVKSTAAVPSVAAPETDPLLLARPETDQPSLARPETVPPSYARPEMDPLPSAETSLSSLRSSAVLKSPAARFIITASTVALITLGVIWVGVHLFHPHANVQQSADAPPSESVTTRAPASMSPQSQSNDPPSAGSPPAAMENAAARTAAPSAAILHQEIPTPSRRARESIRGVISVQVRVKVNPSGSVATASFDDRGSSRYFARAAMNAAKKWKFAPAGEDQASRVWLLDFEFSREGVTAQASAPR